jgi:branched-chain amino acid transport system substrate-binding protein
MKKIIGGLLVIVLAAALMLSCAKKEESVKIGAIFAVTGPASFLGAPESKTVEMLAEELNANGGIDGMKVEMVIKDSAANPESAISFAKQLIEEDQVSVILGPSTSGESMQIKDLCQSAGVPLISCAAAEDIVNPVAPYVFKTPQKDSFVAKWIFDTMNEMGISRIGVVAANTGFGNGGVKQLSTYAPDYGITIAIAETYDRAATDLTALLTKVDSQDVEAVVNWSIVDAQSIIPKNMKQLGMEIPLFQSHGFGNIKYVEAAGAAAEGIIFPAGRLLVAEELPDSHPQKEVLVSYKNDYESKYNEEVSTFGGHAYDAFMIAVEAIKEAGTDRAKIRDAIENIDNFPGTGGVFNFSAEDHNGLGMDSLEMLTVKNGEFVLYE